MIYYYVGAVTVCIMGCKLLFWVLDKIEGGKK